LRAPGVLAVEEKALSMQPVRARSGSPRSLVRRRCGVPSALALPAAVCNLADRRLGDDGSAPRRPTRGPSRSVRLHPARPEPPRRSRPGTAGAPKGQPGARAVHGGFRRQLPRAAQRRLGRAARRGRRVGVSSTKSCQRRPLAGSACNSAAVTVVVTPASPDRRPESLPARAGVEAGSTRWPPAPAPPAASLTAVRCRNARLHFRHLAAPSTAALATVPRATSQLPPELRSPASPAPVPPNPPAHRHWLPRLSR